MTNRKIVYLSHTLLFFLALSFPNGLFAEETVHTSDKPSPDEVQNEQNKEVAFREKDEVEAGKEAVKAMKAFENNQYKESADLYLSAIDKLNKLGESNKYVAKKIKVLKKHLAVVYHYWARDLADQAEKDAEAKKFDEAIAKCSKAVEMDSTLSKRIEKLVKKFEEGKKVAKYREETSEKVVDPTNKERMYQLDILMAQGRKLYQQRLFHRSREKFEKILLMDPYNIQAAEMIKKIIKKMYKSGAQRYKMTRKERDAEAKWKMLSPILPKSMVSTLDQAAPLKKEIAGTKIKKKLEDIMIDHMEFEDASIPAVINMLRIEAKKQDPDHEGVNILYRTASKSVSGGSDDSVSDSGDDTADDSGEEFLIDDSGDDTGDSVDDSGDAFDDSGDSLDADTTDASDTDETSSSGDKTITIMFDDLSLGEAIRNICMAAELKYRVEEYAVVIAARNVPLDELETRIYPIDSEAGMADQVDATGDTGDSTASSVQQYFEQRGIQFPEGAKAVYDSSISRLIITNTPDQLRRIERIIDELNVVDPQVLIECKFVEFQENKANEFSIAWSYQRDSTNPKGVTMDKNGDPLRNGTIMTEDTAFGIIRQPRTDGWTTGATVHALDLEDNANVLSCPRITTQNGEEATIRMVTEIYYPDTWGEPTLIDNGALNKDDAEVGYVSSMPEFGEPTEEGVKLTVTPTVDPDNYTITLDMIPVVQAMAGWIDYSYIQHTSGGTVPNTVRMVIIEARTVTTQVTIYDGETIVMGGIMRDNIKSIDDKWPILGDLPLVGRFFCGTIKKARKENLLIFTTPRLVNPNGAPLRQREVRGKPPFRM